MIGANIIIGFYSIPISLLIVALSPINARADKIGRPPGLIIELEKSPKYEEKKVQAHGPLILDTRKPFEYSMAHFENSYPIRWEDFSQSEEPHRGALDPNIHVLVRKLQALGLGKDREVIILGQGTKGIGEEGRIAWMLNYLGFKKIKTVNFKSFKGKKVFGEAPEIASLPGWTPKPVEGLKIRKSDLEKLIENSEKKTALIDVRSPEEFSGNKNKGEKRRGHIPGAINIPWKSFVDGEGEPVSSEVAKEILQKHNVNLGSTIIFYSSLGVESGYATFVATRAGLNAKNYDGSFWEWADDPNVEVTMRVSGNVSGD